jgi:flavin reductase (DIM6/NTAB) family NADH-FMN oxidoreductase RutF
LRDIPLNLWKTLTSTVGLVSVRHGGITNVMSAEWSYFVNKVPLYVAVVLSPRAATRELLAQAGEFSLTLCGEDQAELADFAGSFSRQEIDKTTSELVTFGEPEATKTPWVVGGLVAMECVLRQTVELPVHAMYVGEVVAAHVPRTAPRPLIKHGSMYTLGEPVRRTGVVVAASLLPDGTLRVGATAPAASDGPWRITLSTGDGRDLPLGEHTSAEFGELLVDVALPVTLTASDLAACRVRVDRAGARAGHAAIAVQDS